MCPPPVKQPGTRYRNPRPAVCQALGRAARPREGWNRGCAARCPSVATGHRKVAVGLGEVTGGGSRSGGEATARCHPVVARVCPAGATPYHRGRAPGLAGCDTATAGVSEARGYDRPTRWSSVGVPTRPLSGADAEYATSVRARRGGQPRDTVPRRQTIPPFAEPHAVPRVQYTRADVAWRQWRRTPV